MQELIKFWSDRGDNIIKFDYDDIKARIGKDEYAKCLSQNGLPEETAPYLNFDNSIYKDDEFMLAEDFVNGDNYFVIGFTGSGNGICIEKDTGRIVWIDAEEGGIHFINSSLEQFYKCMQGYAVFIDKTIEKYGDADGYTEEELDILKNELKAIDGKALEVSEDEEIWAFWAEEIDILYGKLDE